MSVRQPMPRTAAARTVRFRPASRLANLMLTALLVLLAGGGATAQTPGEVTMQLDFVAWGDEAHGLALGEDGDPITARAFAYSQPLSYSGPRLLEIHHTGDSAPAEEHQPTAEDLAHALVPLQPQTGPRPAGSEAPQDPVARELEARRVDNPTLVALVQLPANSRRATVLLAPAGHGTYRAYVINDDPGTLRPGHLRVHNLSPYPVAFRSPGQPPAELGTQGSQTFAAGDGQLIYELAYRRDDDWITQEHNIIPVRPNEQTQMIILRSNHQFFLSGDGSAGGFLQAVLLRRLPSQDDS